MRRPGCVTLIRFLSPPVLILLIFTSMLPHVNAQPIAQDRSWMNAALTPDALLTQMTLAQNSNCSVVWLVRMLAIRLLFPSWSFLRFT